MSRRRLWKILAIAFVAVAGWHLAAGLDRLVGQTVEANNPPPPSADWSQWGGSPARNNAPIGNDIPADWEIGRFDYQTGAWDPDGSKNIRWVARLGSYSYGNPVVAGGRVFVGTNNAGARLARYPRGRRPGVPPVF